MKRNIRIPKPSKSQLKHYLRKWNMLENYVLQESALRKLFTETYPHNTNIDDILIKASSLNAFYSTNIFSIFPVAKHIQKLNIDERLCVGDETLVNDIARVKINNIVDKNFYSFASKYCSHHQPTLFPIYDSYVDKILKYFRDKDNFTEFSNDDLKIYATYKNILESFNDFYNIGANFKELDQYLWLLGKKYFPKKYSKL